MRKLLLRMLFVLIPFLYSIYASSQPKSARNCGTTCFSSEVMGAEKISENCTAYELKVSFSGQCRHALSHFIVGIPCGKVSNVWNSENWKQVVGKDRTTGLSGIKIDDIRCYDEDKLQHFTVKFNLCTNDAICASQVKCWQPQVAYKASTCVTYQTLNVACKTLKASLRKRDVSCFGMNDGSLAVNVEDGTEPFSYVWSENSTGSEITGISAGNYSVTVRDASGAQLILESSIAEPEKILPSALTADASCNGTSDGAIDLSVSGGSGNYSFAWNNGAVTEDVQSLASGSYFVTITDSENCTAQANYTVENTSAITLQAVQVKPDCNASNGAIDIIVTGGRSPYTYSWSNQSTGEDLIGVRTGVYAVTVTDDIGCSIKASWYLRDNNTLNLSASLSATSCTEEGSGAIDLIVSGGLEPYEYVWSNGQNSEDLSNLRSGLYTVVVTDMKGCSATSGFVISLQTFSVSASTFQPMCHGESTGSITILEPVGGTAPYTYEWSNNQTGQEISGLPAGIYSVIVKDATGCSRSVTSTIDDPSPIMLSFATSAAACNTSGFLAVDLSVAGGKAPYSYSWSNGIDTEDLHEVLPGSFTVTVTDLNLCTESLTILVEQQSPLQCLINPPNGTPVCGSAGNILSTSVLDADNYTWSVESTDTGWSLQSTDSHTVTYVSGGTPSSATFTLTIEQGGCIKSCSYTISSCAAEQTLGRTGNTYTSNGLSVYPNPFSDRLQFSWKNPGGDGKLEIFDQYGNTISASLDVSHTREKEFLNISVGAGHLPHGIYYYRLVTKGKDYRGRISKR